MYVSLGQLFLDSTNTWSAGSYIPNSVSQAYCSSIEFPYLGFSSKYIGFIVLWRIGESIPCVIPVSLPYLVVTLLS